MRIYTSDTVLAAAKKRIEYLFDEFDNVIVNISGGKDSTVVRNLALMEAEKRGRLPLKVFHVDLEAEWYTVIEYLRTVYADPRIEQMWVQVPLKKAIFNATGSENIYFHCWDPERQALWMRDKEPGAIKENIYGVEKYDGFFEVFDNVVYPGIKTCRIAGVRADESPGRRMGLTSYETYKGVTWGNKSGGKGHYTFYPLYDWESTDVWKAIHDHGWPYCPIYDLQYQYGVPLHEMRIASLLHASAVRSLFYMQEVEPETWSRLTERVQGANTAGQLRKNFYAPLELPFMFKDWREYRDHLLENIIVDPEAKAGLTKLIRNTDALYNDSAQKSLIRQQIFIILNHEFSGGKMAVFAASHGRELKNAFVRNRK